MTIPRNLGDLANNVDVNGTLQVAGGGTGVTTSTGTGSVVLNTSPSFPANLNFTGTGNRITGDFSNASFANRVAFQTSTTNGNTSILAIPNGTATTAQLQASNNSDPTNASLAQFAAVGSADVRIISGATGTGTFLPMVFWTNAAERLRIDTSGNLTMVTSSFREKQTAVAASNIDLSTGNYFTRTISGTTTFTVSNVPASGAAISFILDLTNGGSATVNWWSNVKWAGGAAPTLTASGRDALGFYTYDNGTTWTGLVLGLDIK